MIVHLTKQALLYFEVHGDTVFRMAMKSLLLGMRFLLGVPTCSVLSRLTLVGVNQALLLRFTIDRGLR